MLEKVIAKRLDQHFEENNLYDKYQLSYRRLHSTETAFLKIQSDSREALDNGGTAVLILLDLSSTFDTIDHIILLERLEKAFGVTGDALDWTG